jgi:lipopolysaccharide export LptBFGC system permease protein LptF
VKHQTFNLRNWDHYPGGVPKERLVTATIIISAVAVVAYMYFVTKVFPVPRYYRDKLIKQAAEDMLDKAEHEGKI